MTHTMSRWKQVYRSTSTNSSSHFFMSSFGMKSFLAASTWYAQYLITFWRMLLCTSGTVAQYDALHARIRNHLPDFSRHKCHALIHLKQHIIWALQLYLPSITMDDFGIQNRRLDAHRNPRSTKDGNCL